MKIVSVICLLAIASCSSKLAVTARSLDPEPDELYVEPTHEEVKGILIADQYMGKMFPEQYKKFSSVVCKSPKLSSKECKTAYGDMIRAKWRLAYPLANEDEVLLYCKANPEKCLTLRDMEIQMKADHMYKAFNEARARQALYEQKKKEVEAWNELQAMKINQSYRSVNCTSNNIAGTVYTNCN